MHVVFNKIYPPKKAVL